MSKQKLPTEKESLENYRELTKQFMKKLMFSKNEEFIFYNEEWNK